MAFLLRLIQHKDKLTKAIAKIKGGQTTAIKCGFML